MTLVKPTNGQELDSLSEQGRSLIKTLSGVYISFSRTCITKIDIEKALSIYEYDILGSLKILSDMAHIIATGPGAINEKQYPYQGSVELSDLLKKIRYEYQKLSRKDNTSANNAGPNVGFNYYSRVGEKTKCQCLD
jgi:hypothetical protein